MLSRIHYERIVCAGVIVVGGAVVDASARLPPGTFDPLGSGTLPLLTAGTSIFLAAALLIRGLLGRSEADAAPSPSRSPSDVARALVFVAVTVGYVVMLEAKTLHFVPTSMLFLAAILLTLNGLRRDLLPWMAATALILPVLLYLCFTRLFVVDLPGAY